MEKILAQFCRDGLVRIAADRRLTPIDKTSEALNMIEGLAYGVASGLVNSSGISWETFKREENIAPARCSPKALWLVIWRQCAPGTAEYMDLFGRKRREVEEKRIVTTRSKVTA